MNPLAVSLGFLEFPQDYTADGGNRSPRIFLKGLDADAVSVAIMVFNPFIKSCCSFTPWIIWNLPPAPVIPEGIPNEGRVTLPISAVQGITDYGITGYTGPQPPFGETHRYQFRGYVLDILLDLPPGSDKHSLVAAMDGHMIQYGETVAICTR
jgi:Raf kinase inhibitor-like YbhB/YbcL family protein